MPTMKNRLPGKVPTPRVPPRKGRIVAQGKRPMVAGRKK